MALNIAFGEDNPRGMPEHLFFGARQLDYKTAERADISKQYYTVCPRYWYVEATFVCRDCDREFVFTAAEQRFGYEDRRFYVDSLPTRCVECRKGKRTPLELRKRYDALIAEALGRCSVETKKQVVEIINELETIEAQIPDRMIENRSTLYAQLSKAS